MARPSKTLINAMKRTAGRLRSGEPYEWGHMGACNCGNLAQELTLLTKGEIHEYAMRGRGDWSEQVEAFCPTSEIPMDLLINQLIVSGLTLEDLINLERLKDKTILSRIDLPGHKKLNHNRREDVILYLESWAEMLQEELERKSSEEPTHEFLTKSP